MKNLVISLMISLVIISFSSCATIIGGSNYNATVLIPDNPNAKIKYKGKYKGTGQASFKVPRKNANKFSVTIVEDGCEAETIRFRGRKFRGWAFVGTLVGWTSISGGVPIPWGVAVDVATGALWKPDANEKGINKENFNNYNYVIDYKSCHEENNSNDTKSDSIESKAAKLRELKKLLDEGILTKEEFEKEKKKIMNR